jgi:ABC-type molybdate transport system substrate-binding protein
MTLNRAGIVLDGAGSIGGIPGCGGVLTSRSEPVSAAGKPVVTVFAAASLKGALEVAAVAFTRASGYPVRFSYGGSNALAAQLLQGAPADVFVSANEAQMNRALLRKLGLLRFPAGTSPEAVYPIAVTRNAPNAAGGRAFIEFVTSTAGRAFLKARAFEE